MTILCKLRASSGAAGVLTPRGAGPGHVAGAKAPPGAGPESLSGAKAPPGVGPLKICRGEAPPGAGSEKCTGAAGLAEAYPGSRNTLHISLMVMLLKYFLLNIIPNI